jgi:hypothetical protein
MKPINVRSTAMWTALSLLLALMVGEAPALAGGVGSGVGLVLYEVTEDMYLLDQNGAPTGSLQHAVRRSAVAQLSGFAKLGTPLCPWEVLVLTPGAKNCTVNATGADDLSLANGKGTVSGTFAVVVQDTNKVDAPEFVVMTGAFGGDADLSLPFAGVAPIGFIPSGKGCIGYPCDPATAPAFTFTGMFRLPFAVGPQGVRAKPQRYKTAYYLLDDFKTLAAVEERECSLGWPTVRLEIKF